MLINTIECNEKNKNQTPSLFSIFVRLYSGVNYMEEEHTCLKWSHLNVMSQFPPSAQKMNRIIQSFLKLEE